MTNIRPPLSALQSPLRFITKRPDEVPHGLVKCRGVILHGHVSHIVALIGVDHGAKISMESNPKCKVLLLVRQ